MRRRPWFVFLCEKRERIYENSASFPTISGVAWIFRSVRTAPSCVYVGAGNVRMSAHIRSRVCNVCICVCVSCVDEELNIYICIYSDEAKRLAPAGCNWYYFLWYVCRLEKCALHGRRQTEIDFLWYNTQMFLNKMFLSVILFIFYPIRDSTNTFGVSNRQPLRVINQL